MKRGCLTPELSSWAGLLRSFLLGQGEGRGRFHLTVWLLFFFLFHRCMLSVLFFCGMHALSPGKVPGKLTPLEICRRKEEGGSTLDRCSWFNYWLPSVIDIFSSGLVHFRLSDYDPFVSVSVILTFVFVRLQNMKVKMRGVFLTLSCFHP
jgi:hypothetical protein